MRKFFRITHLRRERLTVLHGVLLVAVLLGFGTGAGDARESEGSTALLCFISSVGNEPLPQLPSELRDILRSALIEAFTERGFEFCPGDDTLVLMRQRRIRSYNNISSELCKDLVSTCEAERVLIGQLRFFPGQLIVSCRVINPRTGRLDWLDLIELKREPGDLTQSDIRTSLVATLTKTAHELATSWSPPPQGDLDCMIVLPSTMYAGEQAQASLLDECLLRVMLDEGCWWLPEPSLIVTWLAERGQRPHTLHGPMRLELGAKFLNAPLLHVQLISYGDPSPGRRTLDLFTVETPERMFTYPLYCTAQMVNNRSGRMLRAGECYLKGETPLGLFGLPRSSSWTQRFTRLATELNGSIPYHHEVD